MAVVARNERADTFWFVGEDRRRDAFPSGDVRQLSDDELEQVPVSMRGPGGINVLWPTEVTSDNTREMFDYYVPGSGSSFQVRYIGFALQGVLDTQPLWTIKRLSHIEVLPSDVRVTDIQTLAPVAWADRNSLPWS